MKQAYLTIDDGPSKYRKERVDILKKYQIQAVWFSTGEFLAQRKEEAIYTIRQGGIIGNHSYSHPDFSKLSLEEAYTEIERTDTIIEEIYSEAHLPRPFKAFRFPYGNKGVSHPFYNFNYTPEEQGRVNKLQSFLKKLGYETFEFQNINYEYFKRLKEVGHRDWYWTYDAMEWCLLQKDNSYGIKNLADVIELMELDLKEQWMGLNYLGSDEIVLVHDHDETFYTFEPIIEALLRKGIVFKSY